MLVITDPVCSTRKGNVSVVFVCLFTESSLPDLEGESCFPNKEGGDSFPNSEGDHPLQNQKEGIPVPVGYGIGEVISADFLVALHATAVVTHASVFGGTQALKLNT